MILDMEPEPVQPGLCLSPFVIFVGGLGNDSVASYGIELGRGRDTNLRFDAMLASPQASYSLSFVILMYRCNTVLYF